MKAIKNFVLTLTLALIAVAAGAQIQDPVHFTVAQKSLSDTEFEVVFSARIDKGWHVYSTNLPDDGPISATLTTEQADGVEPVGRLTPRGKEIKEYDPLFDMTLRYFEERVQFVQRYKITAKTYAVKGYLEYGACNESNCMPPTDVEFSFKGTANGNESAANANANGGNSNTNAANADNDPNGLLDTAQSDITQSDTAQSDTVNTQASLTSDTPSSATLWQPVISELQAFDGGGDSGNRPWIYIFLMGLVGGFIALFTPCVWPIIPMTVSFFLKRAKDDRKKGIKDAVTYGVSIIVIYLALGLIITAIFGASSLNALATNAVFNVLFFLLLVVFALSFFGWFELTLPSSWTNKVDNKASSTGGLLSIFLMAFTLSLVSFSCTGPIIGFLLVEVSTSGSIAGPAVGMLGFAVALALPFTLFAMFPTWLKQAPRSGSWMNTIKVSLGFIELAFALKFLSVADLAYGWHILVREVFLSLWIVIFGLSGLFLIGKLRFRSDGDSPEAMPVPCIMLGMVSLAFTVYLVPGLWGAPCKAGSAFAPPVYTQDFNLYHNEVEPKYKTYEEGMAAAAAQSKPVVIDFTGFGCVNCRKMEAAVWTDPTVADKLNNDVVLISLYVDDKTPLPEPLVVEESGRMRTLRTIGDKWSYLQRSKFGANAQPFYVILSPDGQPLGGSYSYDENVSHYLDFLNKGINNFKR